MMRDFRLTARAPLMLTLSIVATIAFGLLLDQHGGRYGQHLVDVFVWLLLLFILARSRPREQFALVACVVFATLGEIFLSIVWGLYSYRLDNIPLFVPPGHALLYLLGGQLAPLLTKRLLWSVPALAAPFVVALAVMDADMLGLPLLALLVACMLFGPAARLYAVMFLLALAMEVYGTWLGNWTWSPLVPWFGWPTLNPPLAAGAFYCVLDLLVTLTLRAFARRPAAMALPLAVRVPVRRQR
jgi:hypothetical protein